MLIGYARVSKADGSQSLDLQRCGPRASTPATSTTTSRPASATTALDSTAACARSGRATCSSSGSSTASGSYPRSPAGQHRAGPVDPRRGPAGAHRARRADRHHHRRRRLVFGIFAALAEFERELTRERTLAGLTAARARGRNGGRTFAL